MKEKETVSALSGGSGRKSGRHRAALWTVTAVLLLAMGGATAYYFYKIRDNERREELAYEVLEHDICPADYEAFLEQFPTSPRVPEVRARLAGLREMEAEWTRIERHGSLADFRTFRRRYDVERYRKLCDAKIDSLDFEAARAKNTPEAFSRYLAEHPEGTYYAEAETARSAAERLDVTSEERVMLGSAVEGFFRALGANDAERVCSYVAPKMDVFLGRRGATKADVMDMMEKMFGSHIRSCVFSVGNDMEVVKVPAADGTAGYRTEVSVDQHIRRTNAGKIFGSYRAELVFNAALQITGVRLTEISRRDGKGEESVLRKVIDHLF